MLTATPPGPAADWDSLTTYLAELDAAEEAQATPAAAPVLTAAKPKAAAKAPPPPFLEPDTTEPPAPIFGSPAKPPPVPFPPRPAEFPSRAFEHGGADGPYACGRQQLHCKGRPEGAAGVGAGGARRFYNASVGYGDFLWTCAAGSQAEEGCSA